MDQLSSVSQEIRALQPLHNENRRNCIECDFAGGICSHYKPVSWDGSPFVQSQLGKGQNANTARHLQAVSEADLSAEQHKSSGADKSLREQTSTPKEAERSLSRSSSLPNSEPRQPENRSVALRQIPRNPDYLSGLAPNCRQLLDYFAQKVTQAFSLHTTVQGRFSSTFIPMALQAPTGSHLLAAMLSLSAIHQKHAGVDQRGDLVAYLQYQSVKRLKLPMIGQSREADDVAMATTLMLCLSEIMSGGEKPNSWRLHLQGAAAIQYRIDESDRNDPNTTETPIRSFLRRWSVALEVLALLCGAPMSESNVHFVLHVAKPDGGEHYIDEFHGFTTKLVPVFGEISLINIELRSSQANAQTQTSLDTAARLEIRKQCFFLIKYIEAMINEKNHKFHPAIQTSITSTDRSSFTYLNEAYHHVALLQIYVRILNLPADTPIIQLSVKRTLYCISRMNLSREAGPAVAILQPVFTAGCEACEIGDRENVLEFLETLETAYGMGNVSVAMAFLRELWVQRDAAQEKNVRLRWDDFMQLGASVVLIAQKLAPSHWQAVQLYIITGQPREEKLSQYLTIGQALRTSRSSHGTSASQARPGQNLRLDSVSWVFVGGSYPGVRAAFMRLRNLEIIYASLASSAPVQLQEDFWPYYVAAELSPILHAEDILGRNLCHSLSCRYTALVRAHKLNAEETLYAPRQIEKPLGGKSR